MNSSRISVVTAVALFVLFLAVYFRLESTHKKDMAELQSKVTDLQSKIESESLLVAELRTKVGNLEGGSRLTASSDPTSFASPSRDSQLEQVLAELIKQRSALMALSRASDQSKDVETPDQMKHRAEAGIAVLEQTFAEQQKKASDALEKLDRLRVQLNVPDDVAKLNLDTALYDPQLIRYRPYFEARKVCDQILRFRDILNLKLESERLDVSLKFPPGE